MGILHFGTNGIEGEIGQMINIEELYIKPLQYLFSNSIRLIEEQGKITDIVLDGEEEDFVVSFVYNGRIDVFWNNQQFIFDRGRGLLTSEDTYGNIVYEEMSDLSNDESMANVILTIIEILKESMLINLQEKGTAERTPLGWDEKKEYIIQISKSNGKLRQWSFGNIKIEDIE